MDEERIDTQSMGEMHDWLSFIRKKTFNTPIDQGEYLPMHSSFGSRVNWDALKEKEKYLNYL